ncbi:MAG: DUF721 domain-containing protein [Bifidobacterium breve]
MNPPIARTLHLDERKLPAEVFDRLAKHGGYVMRDRRTRESSARRRGELRQAGRDRPHSAACSTASPRAGIESQLKLAQLRNHWDRSSARHRHALDGGWLHRRRADPRRSAVWATQLTYMLPAHLHDPHQLKGLDIGEIRV